MLMDHRPETMWLVLACAAGAAGFIEGSMREQTVLDATDRAIKRRSAWTKPQLARMRAIPQEAHFPLTRDQMDIVQQLRYGLEVGHIARQIGLDTKRIHKEMNHLKNRLGLETDLQLVAWAARTF
jgi:DNA-binding NarL/FixJ family response regulator